MCRNRSLPWMAAALLFFLSALPAGAGYSTWTSQGPEGAEVISMVVAGNPRALYAGVYGDVLKSLDGGRTWHQSSRGLLQPEIPWDFYLAVDPSDPETLYTGGLEGVYRSTDSGATWTLLGESGDLWFVQSVAISPAAPQTIWAMSEQSGLYVSRDAGASWSKIEGGGFPAGSEGEVLANWMIVPDPQRAGIVYISTPYGLYKSMDGGTHWSLILDAWGPMALDPVHPWKLYAGTSQGLFRSVDGGRTWSRLINKMSSSAVCAVAVDPRTSAVYAAASSGTDALRIYKSTDGGTTWTEGERSPYAAWANTFAFHPSQPSVVFLGSYAGIWKSTDRGRTWAPANHGLSNLFMETITVDPSNPRFVYASSVLAGIYRSTDRGETWTSRSMGLGAWYVRALLVTPFESATIFAGTERGLFRSTDRARTWSYLNVLGLVNSLAAEPAPPFTLYAATREGLFRSTDRGETWSLAWGGGEVLRMAVSPARPSNLFITTSSGLFFSNDRGETWTRRPFRFGSPVLVVADPRRPSTLYVSVNPLQTGAPTLFKSVDSGLTWKPASSGLPLDWLLDVVIDPNHPDVLYAAVGFSVFWTRDGGETWAPLAEDLPSPAQALAIDPSGHSTLHAATYAQGVFELTRIVPPPPGDFLITEAIPGFRFKVLITEPGKPGVAGRQELNCIPRALCVSGKVRRRTDVLIRVDGPQPDGSFSVNVARLTHSQVEVWVERPATGDRRYYRLEAVPAERSGTPGLTDPSAFPGGS